VRLEGSPIATPVFSRSWLQLYASRLLMIETFGYDSRGPSTEFYRRISLVPALAFCAAGADGDRLERLLAWGLGKSPPCGSGSPE